MRVIDADYITEGRVSNDPVVIAAKCAPTIDAIPVEWIKNRLDAMLKGTTSAESCFAVQIMLVDWQKEQEAR